MKTLALPPSRSPLQASSFKLRARLQRGSALVITLVVLAGLTATLAALAASANVAAKEQINRQERARAKQAAMDGIQYSLSVFSQIVEPGGQSGNSNTLTSTNLSSVSNNNNTTGATMLTDDWAQEGQNGDVNYQVGDHYFRMQIVDACSMININCTTSSGTGVNAGCNTAGTVPGITQAQPIGASDQVLNNLPFQPQEVQAIEDYRSTSTTPQSQGAKDNYYQALTNPYNCKELPFETFDELLQVQGLTAKLLYYPRTDINTASNPIADVNGNPEALSQVLTAYSASPQCTPQGRTMTTIGGTTGNITATPPAGSGISVRVWNTLRNRPAGGYQSMGQIIQLANRAGANSNDLKGILNSLRISNAAAPPQPPSATTTTTTQNFPVVNGLVNINTAPLSVLEQLPGMTPTLAQAIVSQQQQGFPTVGDVSTVNGVNAANLAQFADQITATSQTFIVRVIGKAGSTSIPVEAIVSVTNDNPQIISIQEMPFTAKDMIDRWTWDQDTTTDTVLKDNS